MHHNKIAWPNLRNTGADIYDLAASLVTEEMGQKVIHSPQTLYFLYLLPAYAAVEQSNQDLTDSQRPTKLDRFNYQRSLDLT